jgi:predicted permease
MSTLLQDFKYGFRVLRKSPAFAAAAVVVLALGIGANTAIFTVVNAILLRPLPFPDSGRLLQIWHVPPPRSFPGITEFAVSAANYLDWKARSHSFEKMAIYTFNSFNITGKGQPETVNSGAVSADFFSTFEVQPKLGRVFSPDEDQPGKNNVLILSYPFWQSHFGSDPKVIGQTVALDGQQYTIVGVMGPEFRRPGFAQIWTPLAMTPKERAVRGEHHYMVIARLKNGVDRKQAQAELDTISHALEQEYPADDNGWGAIAVPLRDEMVGDVRPALLVLIGAVAFVLLIACANVANLVLAKTLARQKEIAIRTALGASRTRVLRQVLSETLLLSLAGGAIGLYLAHFGVSLIVHFFGDSLPRGLAIGLDTWVLIFTLAASLLAGILAGLAPAWRFTKTNVNEALKQGLGRSASDSGGTRTRSVLLVFEVALSVMLLIGAGLMIRSLWMLEKVNPGFDPQNVLTMDVGVAHKKFDTPVRENNFFQDVLQHVRALPGVDSAGVIDSLPLHGGSNQPIAIEGRPAAVMADQPEVAVRVISPGYLRAMRIPVLQGRDFSDADAPDRPATVLISESMAHRFWPNESPLGKHLTLTFSPEKTREIVGIVGDVKQTGLDVDQPAATLYRPLSQVSASAMADWHSVAMFLVVRGSSQPESLISSVSNAVHQVDKEVPLHDIITLNDFLADSLVQQRFNMLLLASFAALALLLAGVGIYSVLSYTVRRRTREIGVRMALGAQVRDVLLLVMREGMRPAMIGVAIGVIGALAFGRLLVHLIYGVRAADPVTFLVVAIFLAAIAAVACLGPAWRATKIDPMRALRDE